MKIKNIQQVIPSLGLLAVLLFGCNPLQQKLQSVEVVALASTEGVEIEALNAKAYSVPVDENSSAEKLPTQYYFIPNHDILAAIQVKLGNSYSTLLDQYQSAKANSQPLDRYPQLGIQYKFRATVEKYESDYVSFKLSEVFDGLGALIRVNGDQLQIWIGKQQLFSKSSLIADLFDLPSGLQIFKYGNSHFFAFQAKSAGKVFDLSFVGDRFLMNNLTTTLPAVESATHIFVVRVNPIIAAKFSLTNGFLFFFADASSMVNHVYFMDQGFVFRELLGQCSNLVAAGVDAKISCVNNSIGTN